MKSGYRLGALSFALLLSRHTKGTLPYNLAVMMRPLASPDATACGAVLSTLFILRLKIWAYIFLTKLVLRINYGK